MKTKTKTKKVKSNRIQIPNRMRFRAYNNTLKKMYYCDIKNPDDLADASLLLIGCSEPMQSTGLPDNKGVEIFEGDIVEGKCLYTSVVTWDRETAGFLLFNGKHDNTPMNVDSGMTVVGNIYEN